jgi:pyridinium-3,5-bisthiocarboxylic acid mononucleotide nickel chelatase
LKQIILIDPQTAGISGDMLLGALIDAGADTSSIQRVLDIIPLHYSKCKKIKLHPKDVNTHGFRACAAALEITEDKEETRARDFLRASEDIAKASGISEKAASFATDSVMELVAAESRLHGVSADETHLHEAGSADTLADIFGVAAACDGLGVFDDDICSTPVAVGAGIISFSHGSTAAPAPAVLEIARHRSIPIVGGPEHFELTTPTGISMLANLVHAFVENYPLMVPEIIGLGAGNRELASAPNVLRVVVGHGVEREVDTDTVRILETNLDDLPGEVLGHTLQRILESGAKDTWITPAQFKKNRPGHVLHVICDPLETERLTNLIIEETGTLGVRYQQWNRFTLHREIKIIKLEIEGKKFDVRVKFAQQKSGRIVNMKPEFDDIQTIAKELSMPARKVSEMAARELQSTLEGQ